MASIIACTTIDASHDRLRMVSDVLNRCRIGSSMSSAEDSKKDMTVLSTFEFNQHSINVEELSEISECNCSSTLATEAQNR